jgi:hypothetical protein
MRPFIKCIVPCLFWRRWTSLTHSITCSTLTTHRFILSHLLDSQFMLRDSLLLCHVPALSVLKLVRFLAEAAHSSKESGIHHVWLEGPVDAEDIEMVKSLRDIVPEFLTTSHYCVFSVAYQLSALTRLVLALIREPFVIIILTRLA